MKKVLRWRYYCEFCKKAGNSAFHMSQHEAGCTLNPDRKCRMCNFVGAVQESIGALTALLPDPKAFEDKYEGTDIVCFKGLEVAVAAALPALREITNDCPACIMAALRQKGIPVPCAEGFNFTKECKSIFDDVNEERHAATGFGDY